MKWVGNVVRIHLKGRIWAQDQGGVKFQPADILMYFEELKQEPNVEIGFKDFFEMGSIVIQTTRLAGNNLSKTIWLKRLFVSKDNFDIISTVLAPRVKLLYR